jgi:hypothetical protein
MRFFDGGSFDGGLVKGFLMGIFDWLTLLLQLAVCLHQSSFLYQQLYT